MGGYKGVHGPPPVLLPVVTCWLAAFQLGGGGGEYPEHRGRNAKC